MQAIHKEVCELFGRQRFDDSDKPLVDPGLNWEKRFPLQGRQHIPIRMGHAKFVVFVLGKDMLSTWEGFFNHLDWLHLQSRDIRAGTFTIKVGFVVRERVNYRTFINPQTLCLSQECAILFSQANFKRDVVLEHGRTYAVWFMDTLCNGVFKTLPSTAQRRYGNGFLAALNACEMGHNTYVRPSWSPCSRQDVTVDDSFLFGVLMEPNMEPGEETCLTRKSDAFQEFVPSYVFKNHFLIKADGAHKVNKSPRQTFRALHPMADALVYESNVANSLAFTERMLGMLEADMRKMMRLGMKFSTLVELLQVRDDGTEEFTDGWMRFTERKPMRKMLRALQAHAATVGSVGSNTTVELDFARWRADCYVRKEGVQHQWITHIEQGTPYTLRPDQSSAVLNDIVNTAMFMLENTMICIVRVHDMLRLSSVLSNMHTMDATSTVIRQEMLRGVNAGAQHALSYETPALAADPLPCPKTHLELLASMLDTSARKSLCCFSFTKGVPTDPQRLKLMFERSAILQLLLHPRASFRGDAGANGYREDYISRHLQCSAFHCDQLVRVTLARLRHKFPDCADRDDATRYTLPVNHGRKDVWKAIRKSMSDCRRRGCMHDNRIDFLLTHPMMNYSLKLVFNFVQTKGIHWALERCAVPGKHPDNILAFVSTTGKPIEHDRTAFFNLDDETWEVLQKELQMSNLDPRKQTWKEYVMRKWEMTQRKKKKQRRNNYNNKASSGAAL